MPKDIKKESTEKEDSKQKIRIRIKAFDHKIIDQSTKKIIQLINFLKYIMVIQNAKLKLTKKRLMILRDS